MITFSKPPHHARSKGSALRRHLLTLIALTGTLLTSAAWATTTPTCYVILGSVASNPNEYQITPADGKNRSLNACDTCNGNLGLPSTITVSTDPAFQPPGTLLGIGTSTFMQYGNKVPDDPDMVFYRCDPATAGQLYEIYSTNGDSKFGGYSGSEYGAGIGLPASYATYWQGVQFRLTNLDTGRYFTNIWQGKPLTNLDRDSRGFLLIKAKNFSRVQAELYRGQDVVDGSVTTTGVYSWTQPFGYVTFSGPGIAAPAIGSDHLVNYQNWPYWPGTIGIYGNVSIRRSPICAVSTVTPVVTFPNISIVELNVGLSRSAPFTVTFRCQNTAVSGIASDANAIGILISPGSLAAATKLNLVSGGGATHLLSNNYGSPGIASGVGIRIQRNGQNMKLLTSEITGTGSTAGWYPAIGTGTSLTGSTSSSRSYSETFTATLEKLQGQQVTAGRVEATAQVIIRVQ